MTKPTNNNSLDTTLLTSITNSELYFCHHYSPTNNNSLDTTLLTSITNSELYFCHHYSPTNNNSLDTTLLTSITNSELYFCYHYSPSRIPSAVWIYLLLPIKRQEIFFFRKYKQFSLTICLLLYQWRQKLRSNAILHEQIFVKNFFRVLAFKNKFQSIFLVNKNFCRNLYIS